MERSGRRLRGYIIKGILVALLACLLGVGRDLSNPYQYVEQRTEVHQRYGSEAARLLDLAKTLGLVGLYHYVQAESLVHISQARLEFLDRAVQGQSQYVEVLRLQLAMQNMRSDFLEKDLAVAEEKMAALQARPDPPRHPASR